MNQSKIFLLSSLALITGAILLIIIGGSVAFTLASLAFIGSGMLYSKFQFALDFEDFEKKIQEGLIASEEDGEIPDAVVDLEQLSESDKEVVQRLFGIDFEAAQEEAENGER